MCELAVWNDARPSTGSAIQDAKLYQRGDVIDVLPDGADWGRAVLGDRRMRILRVPGMSVEEGSALKAPETGQPANRLLQRRAFRLDLDALSGVTVLTRPNLARVTHRKPSLTDPRAIGGTPERRIG